MHLIWEDEAHVAFLSSRPNTPGFSVVVPRQHLGSYAFAQSDEVLSGLMIAAKKVALLIDRALPDVGRTGLMLEGYISSHDFKGQVNHDLVGMAQHIRRVGGIEV